MSSVPDLTIITAVSRAIDDHAQPFSPRVPLPSDAIAVFTVHPYTGQPYVRTPSPTADALSPEHTPTSAHCDPVVCGICLESEHSPPTAIPQVLLNTPQLLRDTSRPLPRPRAVKRPIARHVTHTFNPLVTLPCNHVFHLQCIRKHIFHRGTGAACPQCRGEMPHYMLYRRQDTRRLYDDDNNDVRETTPSTHRPLTRFDVVCRNVVALGVIIAIIVVVSTHMMRTEYTNE